MHMIHVAHQVRRLKDALIVQSILNAVAEELHRDNCRLGPTTRSLRWSAGGANDQQVSLPPFPDRMKLLLDDLPLSQF